MLSPPPPPRAVLVPGGAKVAKYLKPVEDTCLDTVDLVWDQSPETNRRYLWKTHLFPLMNAGLESFLSNKKPIDEWAPKVLAVERVLGVGGSKGVADNVISYLRPPAAEREELLGAWFKAAATLWQRLVGDDATRGSIAATDHDERCFGFTRKFPWNRIRLCARRSY